MKSRKLKYAILGAVILGGIHLALVSYCMKEGGDTSMAIIFIDYPLYLFSTLLEKVFAKPPDCIFYIYYFGLGTLIYALLGSIIGIILEKIISFVRRQGK